MFALTSIFAPDPQSDPVIDFVVGKMVFGAWFGVMSGATLLLSNAFGVLSLLRHVDDPLAHIVVFLVGGAMFFAPLTLATANGLLPLQEAEDT
jgi:hypothetical protein